MHILLYCDDPGCGGTAVNAGLLVEGLVREGFAVTLAASTDLTGGAPGVAFFRIDYDSRSFHLKAMRGRNEPEAILMATRPDVVFFCDGAPDSSLAAKGVCRDWGVPYVAQVNYVAPGHAAVLGERREVVARALEAAVAVVAVSTENLLLLRHDFNVPESRSGVIHNGRPRVWFEPSLPGRREALRRSFGLAPNDVLCLTVARYEPRKGYRHLLEVASTLVASALPVRFVFAWIGQSVGTASAVLTQAVAARGLSDRVAVLGERKDVRDWLCAADIFVLPSESEGMPLSIIEAMGQGVPVVATAVSGIPEEVGDAGLLVPDPGRDSRSMVAVLTRILIDLGGDPERRWALGQAGRRRAMAHFTAEAMTASFAGLLRSLAGDIAAATPRWPDPRTYRPPHLAVLGQDIRIGEDATAIEFLKDGWSHGEGAGRWTDGDQARLVVALPRGLEDGFVLLFEAKPFLGPAGGTLTARVMLNGRAICVLGWTDTAEERRVELAAFPDGSPPREVEIVLAIEGATSPASHGLSDDTRKLGLWLSRLRLERIARPGL